MATSLSSASRDEIHQMMREEQSNVDRLADRFIQELNEGATMPALGINRLEHSLQTATRALRAGASDEWVIAALLHDVGDGLAPLNHGELAAAALRPYVSEEVAWVIEHHPKVQFQYFADKLDVTWRLADEIAGSPYLESAVRFCRDWDEVSFDPDYDTLPLETFEPVLRRLLASSERSVTDPT